MKYLLLVVDGQHEIHECPLEDLDRVAARLGKEGKTVFDIFDTRECAEKASGLEEYSPDTER